MVSFCLILMRQHYPDGLLLPRLLYAWLLVSPILNRHGSLHTPIPCLGGIRKGREKGEKVNRSSGGKMKKKRKNPHKGKR
jgi:hypothetical protein